jgi:hypothetical protein
MILFYFIVPRQGAGRLGRVPVQSGRGDGQDELPIG